MPPEPKKVAMVSGANRGIGLAMAKALASAGYRLSLGVRDPDATPTAGFAETNALVQRYDAANPADARGWVDATVAGFGRIDVLINNAGRAEFATRALRQMLDEFQPLRVAQRLRHLGELLVQASARSRLRSSCSGSAGTSSTSAARRC